MITECVKYHRFLATSSDSSNFKDTAEKKHHQTKLHCLRKVGIWAFGSLVHQINTLEEVHQLRQNFKKNNVVTGKILFFVIGPFCTSHSAYANIDF